MHYKNIHALATEMFKVANGMSPDVMNEIFQLREESHYNLRYTSNFFIPLIHSVYHDSEYASYLGPKIWELIPPVIRQIKSFNGFKKERNENQLIAHVGFARYIFIKSWIFSQICGILAVALFRYI